MEIIPLIPERDVAIQRARVAQNRDVRSKKALRLKSNSSATRGWLIITAS